MASLGFSRSVLIQELRALYQVEKHDFYRIIGFGVVQGILSLIVPIAIGNLINAVSFGTLLQPVVVLTILVLVFLLAAGAAHLIQLWFIELLQRRLFARVAYDAATRASGEIGDVKDMNYFTEVFALQKSLISLLTEGSASIIAVVIGMVVIALYHSYFLYFDFLIILVAGYAVGYVMVSKGFVKSYEESNSKFKLLTWLQKRVTQKKAAIDDEAIMELSRDYLEKRKKVFLLVFRQHLSLSAVHIIGSGLVLVLGGYLVLLKEMSLGQLVAAELIVSSMLAKLAKFGKYFESCYDVSDAVLKLKVLKNNDSEHVFHQSPRVLQSVADLLDTRWQRVALSRWFAVFGLMLIGTLFLPWQQTSLGEGRVVALTPTDRQQTIEAPVSGRIAHWHVHEGSLVKKGDKLATISDLDPQLSDRLEQERSAMTDRVRAAQSRVDSVESRITSLQLARSEAVSAAENRAQMAGERVRQAQQSVTATEAALDAAKANYDRQKSLMEQGLTSQRNVELAELDYKRARTEEQRAVAGLKSAEQEKLAMKRDAKRIARDADAAINDARAGMQSARSDLARGNEDLPRVEQRLSRQKSQEVLAPKDGVITRLLVSHEAEFVKEGKGLCVLIPESGRRAVELWVDGNDIALLTGGREARLMFQGWPALQMSGWPQTAFGTFPGRLKFVDNADDGHGKFRVLVIPDEASTDYWPDSALLRQGIRARGWIFLNRVTVGYELWRKFNDFPPEIPRDMRGGQEEK